MNVMLVEDDRMLGQMIAKGLNDSGYQCAWVTGGRDAIAALQKQQYDVVVLDRMLPDVSGMDVLQFVRQQSEELPVLMLTAMGSLDNRVEGLQAGADDYLVKPFELAELLARLNALTRRVRRRNQDHLEVGPLKMDLVRRQVSRDGRLLEITPTEFSMLELLMREAGQVVTRKMICQHLWDEHWEGLTNVVEVHINRLRAKIDREFSFPLLHTVRGRGYLMEVRT